MLKSKREIGKYSEVNENENITYQKFLDDNNSVLGGTLSTYIRREERSQINDFSFHLKKLEKKSR